MDWAEEDMQSMATVSWPILVTAILGVSSQGAEQNGLPPLVRSAVSGRWSEPATWEGGKVPIAGQRVQIRIGHHVVFDTRTEGAIRSIHVAGTLRFDPDRDTRLDVGLIKIQAGDDPGESGFDCETHVTAPDPRRPRPALEIGTPDQPIAPEHHAVIRLTAVPGLDPEECPAIVCCGGRWDVHGSPLDRTWVKLGASAAKGTTTVELAEPVRGWRVGDRIIITATGRKGYRAIPRAAQRSRTPANRGAHHPGDRGPG